MKFDVQMFFTGLRFRPDLFISHGSIYAAHAAFLLGKKHLSLEDSGNMEQIVLYRPFTDVILTPDVLPEDLGPQPIRYEGYHEIAYLHPDYFNRDPEVYNWLGLKPGEKYLPSSGWFPGMRHTTPDTKDSPTRIKPNW